MGMSNRHDSAHIDFTQAVESESRITGNFSSLIKEYDTKSTHTFTPVFTAADGKVIASSAELHDIFQDLSSLRMDGYYTPRSHGESTGSRSTLSGTSVGAHALPIGQLEYIPRVPRTTQPTASQDIPLAILERMAHDTAVSALSLRGVSSFSVTPLSLGLNSDRGVLGRSAPENQVRMSFSPERSNCMAAASLAVSPGAEAPLTVVSPALSHDLLSKVSTHKGSDVPLKTELTTCLEHVISGNRSDAVDTRLLTSHERDLSGTNFRSCTTELTFDRKPSLESRNDGLNAVLLEYAHIGPEKLNKSQRSSDSHLIRQSVPDFMDATKRHEPLCQVLSPDHDHNEKGLDDEVEGCSNLHEVPLLMPADVSPSDFLKPKEVPIYDRLMTPASRVCCSTFQTTTPAPLHCRGRCGTHHCACSERNSTMTPCAFNNPKEHSKNVASTWVTPKGTSTGAASSSLVHHKDASSLHMEPFKTWSFPTLFKSFSSPFQSPLDDSFNMNTNGNVLEGVTVGGEGRMLEKEDRALSLGFLNHSPRVKLQLDYACTDEQSGCFSPRLEAARNTWSRQSRMHKDPAAKSHRDDEETQDANQQRLRRPSGNLQHQGHDAGLATSVTKDDIELPCTWEMIYSTYVRNCSAHLGSDKVISSYEGYSSFNSSRACQQCGFDAGNSRQKTFQSAHSFNSHKNARSYGIPTPSTSVSGALSRSAGHYSFGNRLTLHHPNYQKMGFIPQNLGSFTHTQTSSQSPSSHAAKEILYSNLKLQKQENTHMIMDPAVTASIQRRPLLQATVFLRYTWALSCRSSRGNGGASDEGKYYPEPLPSNANGDGGLPCIPEDCVQTNQLPNTVSNIYSVDSTSRENDNSYLTFSLAAPRGNIEKTIMAGTSTLHTLTQNSFPLRQACEGSNEETINIVNNSAGCKFLPREVATSLSNSNLEVISPPHPLPRDSTQDVLRFASPSFQGQHRPSLTQFKRILRHQHSIDNLVREVDNTSNDLIVYVGTRLMGWLEVVALLGSGSFGQVFLCMDLRVSSGLFVHPSKIGGEDFAYWSCSHEYLPLGDCDIPPTHSPLVAVKVVKSIPLFEQQSVLEAEMLVLIGVQTATVDSLEAASQLSQTQNSALQPPPPDPRCAFIGKILAHGVCYGHHCIVMERYGANLYEYIQSHQHNGLPMYQIRTIARQLLSALTLLHEDCHIIHADIKPENLLLTLDSCRVMYSSNNKQQNGAKFRCSVISAAAETLDSEQAAADFVTKYNNVESHYFHGKLVASDVENSFTSLNTAELRIKSGSAAVHGKNRLFNNCIDASTRPEALTGQSLKPRSRSQSADRRRIVASKPQRFQDLSHILSQQQPTSNNINKTVGLPVGSLLCSNSLEMSMSGCASLTIPSLHIKLIDFSSSCYDAGPFYTYIQSRYYRAPEVIVNAGYGPPIDLWSTGCVLVELLLGMPLLPGCNDHHQLTLIEEMVGLLPTSLLESGNSTHLYYEKQCAGDTNSHNAPFGGGPAYNTSTTATTFQAWKKTKNGEPVDNSTNCSIRDYKLVSKDDFLVRNNLPMMEYKRYFTCKTLQELVRQCPLPLAEKRMGHGLQPYMPPGESSGIPSDAKLSETMCNELMKQRFLLYDLLRQLLNPDPLMRPTATQALSHPFLSSEFTYMQQFGLE